MDPYIDSSFRVFLTGNVLVEPLENQGLLAGKLNKGFMTCITLNNPAKGHKLLVIKVMRSKE